MNNPVPRHVLILGARGRFGLAAAKAFAEGGWSVSAQVRPGSDVPAIPGIRWLPLGLDDANAVTQTAKGASVVLHALNPVFTDWEHKSLPLLDASLQIARRLGARLMMPGNVYNFGSRMPALLSEDVPQRADTRKGLVRMALEQQLQQAARDGDVRSVVVRAGEFFGSGRGLWFDRALVRGITGGRMTYPGSLDVATAWAYLPDLARAFVRVADQFAKPGVAISPFDVFHFQGHSLTGGQWAGLLDVVAHEQRWLADDDELRTATLPWQLIELGSQVWPMWRELAEVRYMWQTPHALSGTKLAALIGPEPRTALRAALQATLHELGLVGAPRCGLQAWA